MDGADLPERSLAGMGLAALEHLPDGVAVCGEDGRILAVNTRLAQLSGYTATELVGELVEVLVPAASRQRHVALRSRFQAAAGSRVMGQGRPLEMRHRDGSPVAVDIGLASMATAGRPVTVVSVRDLREHLALLERLRASEASFRAVFEQAPVGVAVVRVAEDGSGVIEQANPAMAHLLGVPAADLPGRATADFAPLPERAAAQARELLSGGGTVSRMEPIVRADGASRWMQFVATPIALPDSHESALLVFAMDVTAQRTAQLEQDQRSAADRLTAEVTRAVLSAAPSQTVHRIVVQGVAAVLDADDAVLEFSDPGTGQSRPVATTRPDGVPPATHTRLTAELATQEALAVTVPTDVATGRTFPVHGAGARFTDHDGLVSGMITVCRCEGGSPFTDTEVALLAHLARQLSLAIALGRARRDRERLALLEDRQRIARDLHDTVAQDLIAIGMQLVGGLGGELDPVHRERRDSVIAQLDLAVRHLREAVFELREPVARHSLAAETKKIIDDARRILGYAPTLSTLGTTEDLPANLTQQAAAVIHEALSNVARHARATSTGVTVAVRAGRLVVTVTDDGVGIDPNAVPGHGLANIRARAQALGGKVTLRRRRPAGTLLSWSVPVPDAAAHVHERWADAEPVSGARTPASG